MTKIMLVEDDNNLREIYEARLSAEGYEIVAAENGEAALAIAAKERPDMIISDVMMPKISGFEMLDILRNTDALRNVKIIMLTALGQAEDSQRADSLGADRYLVKSQVTLEDIVKATHDLMDDPNSLGSPPVAAATDPVPEAPAAETTVAPSVTPPEPVVAAPVETPPTPAPDPVVAPAPSLPTPPEPQPDQSVPAELPEPATVPAPDPTIQMPQAPAPSVISIPVGDASDNDSAVDSSADDSQSPQASLPPVVEPPLDTPAPPLSIVEPPTESAADTVSEAAPTDESTEGTSAQDYTSPTAFGNFQAAPTLPAATDAPADLVIEPASESPESAEPVATGQTENFVADQPAPTEELTTSTDTAAPAAPAVEIPTLIPEQDSAPASNDIDFAVPADGPADPVPAPEELDAFLAPVIDAPEGTNVPEPQDVPVASQNEPVAAPNTDNDDQLREVAAELSADIPNGAAENSDNAPRRVITPVSPDEAKPTIHQLLELEEAKNSAQQAASGQQPSQPNVNAYNPSSQQPPAQLGSSDIDPNSIAL
jgi:CheY-like chemotaxis protein